MQNLTCALLILVLGTLGFSLARNRNLTAATIEDKIDLGNFGLSKDPRGLMNLPVGPGGWSDRLGSSREETALLPPILDVIVPNGMKQQDILRGFNVNEKRLATIPGVVPSPN